MSRAQRRREWRATWPAQRTTGQLRRHRRKSWLYTWRGLTVGKRPAWMEATA